MDAGHLIPTIAFKSGQSEAAGGIFVTEEYSPTLQAQNNGSTAVPAIAFDCMASGMNGFGIGEVANPQRVGTNSSGAAHQAVQRGMQVRRLTPLETERLMGFPDGYTAIRHKGKPAADGPRYKSHGNSWAINCPRWIGERIEAVEAIAAMQEAA